MAPIAIEVLNSSHVYNLREVCDRSGLSAEQIIEFVDYGIAEPEGDRLPDWRFNTTQLLRVSKAVRLQRDLGVNLPGLALALDLIDQVNSLQSELNVLQCLLEGRNTE